MLDGVKAELIAFVWPSYIGYGNDGQLFLPPSQRAQIFWRPEGQGFVGGARCWVPKGTYTQFMFFRDPDGPDCGAARFDHPWVQAVDGWVVVDPIRNNDPIVSEMSGVSR